MTVLEVIRSATGYLEKQGVESPRLSAEHLLAKALGIKRLELYLLFDRPVAESEREPLRDWVRRRGQGEPLQHILGEWDFCGRTFQTDARGLIPRPETELLVERVLAAYGMADTCLRVLDIGTGSGAIAISLALERPQWNLTATDISADALSLAQENALRHGVQDRIQWQLADIFPAGPDAQKWDVVVSNPPYIPTHEISQLAREVQRDPWLALDGGEDGLAILRRLIGEAAGHIASGGKLFLEIGCGQSLAVREVAEAVGFTEISVVADYADIPRLVEARWP